MSELCCALHRYDGPIYMSVRAPECPRPRAESHVWQHPTKAICPILLEDYRKITVERKGETNFFTTQMIKDCMKKGCEGGGGDESPMIPCVRPEWWTCVQ